MFHLATKGNADIEADSPLSLLPAVTKTSKSAPLDDASSRVTRPRLRARAAAGRSGSRATTT
jgi:hypothetical protein